jgi:putative transposase
MAHTFTHLLTHIVFSTKDRRPFLDTELKSRLLPYLGGIIRELDGKALIINGPADHVHILASLAAKHSLSDLMRELKADSSGWVHKNYPNHSEFAWQIGYGAFSVSHSNLAEVEKTLHTRRNITNECRFRRNSWHFSRNMKFNTMKGICGNEFSSAPTGAWICFGRFPTAHAVGYYQTPFHG